MRKQLELFYSATVVIAPHGAGLANSIVCREDTAIVLLPMRPMVDMTFIHLAAALGHRVFIATDVTSYYYSTFGKLSPTQVRHVVDAVQSAIDWRTSLQLHEEL